MKKTLAWLAGAALGIAALLHLRRRPAELRPRRPRPIRPTSSSAGSTRRVRPTDDRDEFDAAEGQPVDEIEPTRSIAERRQAVHEKAREALGEMQSTPPTSSRREARVRQGARHTVERA